MYRDGIIGWKSKRQTVISHSTAESEIMALDDAVRDMIWERQALSNLGDLDMATSASLVEVDNRAAVDLAKNCTAHDSTKHIHSRYLYVRELISNKDIRVEHIAGALNPADIFTKPLSRDILHKHLPTLHIEKVPQLH